jgi:23S rRNA (guanosine2251-2'-O)-methyltransferase
MDPSLESIVYGIHATMEVLQSESRKCSRIVVMAGQDSEKKKEVINKAKSMGIRVEILPRAVFQKKFQNRANQGIIAYVASLKTLTVEELIRSAYRTTDKPTLAILDSIEDPQNLGAFIRSAGALDCHGLILPTRRAAPLNATVAKVSAGAIERLPIAETTSLQRAFEILRDEGFWIYGLDALAPGPCWQVDFNGPVAFVIGNEAKGIRPLLKKSCDFLISIPMSSGAESLNAGGAGAIVLYEILRQKRNAASGK